MSIKEIDWKKKTKEIVNEKFTFYIEKFIKYMKGDPYNRRKLPTYIEIKRILRYRNLNPMSKVNECKKSWIIYKLKYFFRRIGK